MRTAYSLFISQVNSSRARTINAHEFYSRCIVAGFQCRPDATKNLRSAPVDWTMSKRVIQLLRVSTERQAADDKAGLAAQRAVTQRTACLLYTSDAADDLLCVDLGGRR